MTFITVVQFIEELPDRQASDGIQGRIDLKYALGLELSDPSFVFTLLSNFRTRLVQRESRAGTAQCPPYFVQGTRRVEGMVATTHWLSRFWQLARDYEGLPTSSKAFI